MSIVCTFIHIYIYFTYDAHSIQSSILSIIFCLGDRFFIHNAFIIVILLSCIRSWLSAAVTVTNNNHRVACCGVRSHFFPDVNRSNEAAAVAGGRGEEEVETVMRWRGMCGGWPLACFSFQRASAAASSMSDSSINSGRNGVCLSSDSLCLGRGLCDHYCDWLLRSSSFPCPSFPTRIWHRSLAYTLNVHTIRTWEMWCSAAVRTVISSFLGMCNVLIVKLYRLC